MSSSTKTSEGVVALFNASDDTIDMVQKLLTASGGKQTLIWCHFADLKKGIVNFGKYMGKHNPEVVVFDLSPPYDENWQFFKTMRDAKTMKGRGVVLTTTNKARLDEVLGEDSHALEVVGKPKDLHEIDHAIKAQTRRAKTARLALA
jgi:DNA-binding response OmpR family regulator